MKSKSIENLVEDSPESFIDFEKSSNKILDHLPIQIVEDDLPELISKNTINNRDNPCQEKPNSQI